MPNPEGMASKAVGSGAAGAVVSQGLGPKGTTALIQLFPLFHRGGETEAQKDDLSDHTQQSWN